MNCQMKNLLMYILFVGGCVNCTSLRAQDIDAALLQKIKNGYHDTHFSIRVKTQGITDQGKSGRCWLFSTLNILRAEVMEKHDMAGFEFSQTYNYFWDILEKSNMFLENVQVYRDEPMDSQANLWLFSKPIGDGGHFANAANVIKKYGLVPKQVMPETYSSQDNAPMMALVRTKLREYGLYLRSEDVKDLRRATDLKTKALADIYRILLFHLGEPPAKFTWTRRNAKGETVDTREYTPKGFYQTYVQKDLVNDYILFMNDPTREYYKVYEVGLKRNCYEGNNWRYVNLPMDELRKMAVASLRGNTMLYFSCDVIKYRLHEKGWLDVDSLDYPSLMGVGFPMNKKERIESCDSFSDHAMALAGVDLDEEGKPVKWLVENSFGKENGYNGYLVMSDRWFGENLFRFVAEKRFVPQNIIAIWEKEECIPIPGWNPVF